MKPRLHSSPTSTRSLPTRARPSSPVRSSTATTMSPTSWATPTEPFSPRARSPEPKPARSFFRLLTDSSRDYYFARTNDYSDVNRGDWFNNAISTLSNAGIVTGYNDGTFRPNQPITRGEMAKIIANFANLKYGGKTFTDLAGHWSKSYVELAAGNGWIAGYRRFLPPGQ